MLKHRPNCRTFLRLFFLSKPALHSSASFIRCRAGTVTVTVTVVPTKKTRAHVVHHPKLVSHASSHVGIAPSRDPSRSRAPTSRRRLSPSRGAQTVRSYTSWTRASPRLAFLAPSRGGEWRFDRPACVGFSFFRLFNSPSASLAFSLSWPARDSTTSPPPTEPTRSRRPDLLPRGSDPRTDPPPPPPPEESAAAAR
jgi:hypothetical protein